MNTALEMHSEYKKLKRNVNCTTRQPNLGVDATNWLFLRTKKAKTRNALAANFRISSSSSIRYSKKFCSLGSWKR